MYNESVEEELKLLVRAVQSTRPRFVAVQYNHYDLVRKAKQELKNAYPARKANSFSLEQAESESFISSIIDCEEGLIFLEKFELLFTEKLQSLAISFNQRRDLFSAHPLQIILFISEGNDNLKRFQKTLPDVFSITNPFVELHQIIEKTNINSSTLDLIFRDANEAEQEIERVEKRLKIIDDTPDSESLFLRLTIYLAQAYKFIGDYKQNKEILTELLTKIEEKKVQASTDTVIQIESSLANTLQALEDYQGAVKLFEKVINSSEKAYGQNHSLTVLNYSNFASLLREAGLFAEARRYMEKVVRSHELNFGKDHPLTVSSYSNLALVLLDLNDVWSAKQILEEVTKYSEVNFGKKSLPTADSYLNLAAIYQLTGNYLDAKKLLSEVYGIYVIKLGENHPNTKQVKKELDLLP